MPYTTIEFTPSSEVARIVLARPDRLNAISMTMCEELVDAVAALAKAPPKVLVLTGKGDAFSVGGDIDGFIAARATLRRDLHTMASRIHEAVLGMRRLPSPVVVGVNGVAAGGGFSLVCMGDLAVAKRSAKLVSAYTRSGLTPDCGGSWFLPRLVGRQRAFDLMTTNRTLTADEACVMGIVSRVADDADFERALHEVASQIAGLPSGAGLEMKRLLDASEARTLEEHLADEAESIARNASKPDTLAMLDAFLARRV